MSETSSPLFPIVPPDKLNRAQVVVTFKGRHHDHPHYQLFVPFSDTLVMHTRIGRTDEFEFLNLEVRFGSEHWFSAAPGEPSNCFKHRGITCQVVEFSDEGVTTLIKNDNESCEGECFILHLIPKYKDAHRHHIAGDPQIVLPPKPPGMGEQDPRPQLTR